MTSTAESSPDRKPARRYVAASLAGGAGGFLALLFFLLEHRPELARLLLERVLIAWGPQFVILLLLFAFLYLLADRYAPRLISAHRETAVALQSLANSVDRLVARDDSFQREQDVLLNHVARRVEALHKLMENHHRALNGHLAKLSKPAAGRAQTLSQTLSGAEGSAAEGSAAEGSAAEGSEVDWSPPSRRKPRPARPRPTPPRP